eukprot:8905561-Lingulodinium_polyedra.AAC.1
MSSRGPLRRRGAQANAGASGHWRRGLACPGGGIGGCPCCGGPTASGWKTSCRRRRRFPDPGASGWPPR